MARGFAEASANVVTRYHGNKEAVEKASEIEHDFVSQSRVVLCETQTERAF